MRIKGVLGFGLLLAISSAFAQLVDMDPDWKELEVPPPPAFKTDGLVYVDMPRYVTVKLGVDPETLRITNDGIVRYVMVATSPSGSTNATYEGIRCLTGEVKTYARYGTTGKWNALADPQWKPLNGNQPSLHALALARQGACLGRSAAAPSAEAIISTLKNPPRGSGR